MKKLSLLVWGFALALHGYAQDRYLSANQYPEPIKTYVAKHFPKLKINSLKEDRERNKIAYELKLSDSTEIKFDKSYQVKEIESHKALPKSVLPLALKKYVTTNYPSHTIVAWEKERSKQKLELKPKVELVFDLKGNFLRIDP